MLKKNLELSNLLVGLQDNYQNIRINFLVVWDPNMLVKNTLSQERRNKARPYLQHLTNISMT